MNQLVIESLPVVGALIIVVILTTIHWRYSVKAAFVLVIFEGVLRKWVLPQASDLIYFLKDFILIGSYINYYLDSEPKYPIKNNFLNLLIFLAFGWCLFQAFNPSLGSPIIGFFGIKAYFLYIPLMWMLPNLFKSEEELYEFLRNHLILIIPVCTLAIVQFFSPASSPINIYAGGKDPTATFAGEFNSVRVTGTFPYISGFAVYLAVCFTFLLPLLTVKQKKLWRLLTIFEALLVVGTSFMTGARGLLIYEVIFIGLYGAIFLVIQPNRATRLVQRLLIPISIISAAIPHFFGKAIDAFSYRANSSDDMVSRIFAPFNEPLEAFNHKQLDGYGTGATHQAISTLRGLFNISTNDPPPPGEGEMGRIAVEIGPIGFCLWYLIRLVLIVHLWQVFLKSKKPFFRQLALAALLFQAIQITGHLVFNNTFSIYYWFMSGFIFLLPYLEKKEKIEAIQYQQLFEQHNV